MKPKLITKLGRERMEKMIAYLRQLPAERFDFGDFAITKECGTVGCVVGHTPAVFPDLCRYQALNSCFNIVTVTDCDAQGYEEVGSVVFGVDYEISEALFTPNTQRRLDMHGIEIPAQGSDATAVAVADMLASFLAQVDDFEPDAAFA